jgi:histidinol-phosphate phosphatase family protein
MKTLSRYRSVQPATGIVPPETTPALQSWAQRQAAPQFGAPPPASRAAVFVDKDGTLVENVPYNADPALLRFVPGACESLAALSAAGYALVLVTNQSGLAHGYFTRAQFAQLQNVLQQRLRDEAGVELLDFVVCPHAPGPGGAPACLCRKPAPGMLLRSARKYRLDLARSWMVGDTLDDVEAGRRAGCRTVLFDSGGETLWRRSPLRKPSARCTEWAEIVQLILASRDGATATEGPAACAP